MIAAGPEAKRPPHIWLLVLSSLIVITGRWRFANDGRKEIVVPAGAPDRHRGAGRRARRRGRGICQRHACLATTRPTRIAAGDTSAADDAACAAKADAAKARRRRRHRRGRRHAARRPAAIADEPRLQRAGRQADDARRPCRQDGAAQSLGDLVRAVPRRDAGARTRCRRRWAATASRSWPSMSTPATTPSRRNSSPRPASTRSPTTATTRSTCSTTLKKRGLALGLPVTLLIDGEGCLLANMNGPADWASDDAKRCPGCGRQLRPRAA